MSGVLVLASHNPGKLAELGRILDGLGLRLRAAARAGLAEVAEDGATFTDNARRKAWAATRACGMPAVADDSGLVVDALGGQPGVRSARYAGRHGDDRANTELLLERLRDVERRQARFVCVAVLALPDGTEAVAEGVLEGSIGRRPRGRGGFGYDPVFLLRGRSQTAAQLSARDKDAISHRGRALRALRPAIVDLLAP